MRSWSSIIPTLVALGASLGCQQQPVLPAPELLFFDSPATWVPPLPALRVSNDQKWAVFGRGRWLELVNLETGRADDERKRGNLDTVTDLAFPADGDLVRRGARDGQTGWFLEGGESLSSLPPNAIARWSPRETAVAHYEAGNPHTVMVGAVDAPRRFELESNIRALEWSHDGSGVFVLITDEQGASSSGLDWTPDGETIVYSARSEGRFQIFAVSRSGGAPRRLSDDGGNLLQPQVSPDGRWIAATRIEFTRELWRQSAIED